LRLYADLFEDAPFSLFSQEADDSPFVPSAAVQRALPGVPPIDWDHVRQKKAARKRQQKRRKQHDKSC
jgi:hypothetical protein